MNMSSRPLGDKQRFAGWERLGHGNNCIYQSNRNLFSKHLTVYFFCIFVRFNLNFTSLDAMDFLNSVLNASVKIVPCRAIT